MIDLDTDELAFLEAVEAHGAGPADEEEMRHAERLIALELIVDLPEPDGEAMALTERGRNFLIAWRLSAAQRRVLVACVRHEQKQDRKLERDRKLNPRAIRQTYFAYGADKRMARRLLAANLLHPGSSFAGTGAEVRPSDLGIEVAKLCPDWDVIALPKRRAS